MNYSFPHPRAIGLVFSLHLNLCSHDTSPKRPALTTIPRSQCPSLVPVVFVGLTTTGYYVSVLQICIYALHIIHNSPSLPTYKPLRPKTSFTLFSAVFPILSTTPGTQRVLNTHLLNESVGINAVGLCCIYVGTRHSGAPQRSWASPSQAHTCPF